MVDFFFDVNLLFKLRNIIYVWKKKWQTKNIEIEYAVRRKFCCDESRIFRRSDEWRSRELRNNISHQQLSTYESVCFDWNTNCMCVWTWIRIVFMHFIIIYLFKSRHVTPLTDANGNDWPLHSTRLRTDPHADLLVKPLHISHTHTHTPFEFKRLQLPNTDESRVSATTINMRKWKVKSPSSSMANTSLQSHIQRK